MSRPDTVTYRPSPLVSMGKAVLGTIARVTPPAWYRRIYGSAHWLYRVTVRGLYLRRWVGAAVAGNAPARARAWTVFRVMPYSLVGWSGLEATYDALTTVNREEFRGAIVECGVAQGGCAALMALTDRAQRGDRRLWLCDSYEGLPDPTSEDYKGGTTGTHARPLPRGACLGTEDQVSELLFQRFRLPADRITLVKGWFRDTLPGVRGTIGPIGVLRIDADWYESVKCCLENLYDAVVPQGFIIIDDYGSCFGAQKAVDGFLQERGLRVTLEHDRRGGCLFRKPQ